MAAAQPILIETPTTALRVIETRSTPEVARAEALVINSQASYDEAASFLKGCKALQNEIVETLADAVEKAHEAHKALTTLRAKHLDPLKKAETVVKQKMAAYSDEQERLAAEERRRQEREARKAEEERQLREAAELEARGDTAGAEEAISAPIVVPVVRQAPKVAAAGTSTRKKYRAQVIDEDALIRAVADGKAMKGLVIANQSALDKLAESLKEGMEIPGVKVVSETIVSARGR